MPIDDQLTDDDTVAFDSRPPVAVGVVDDRPGPAVTLLQRVCEEVPGITGLGGLGAHAGAVDRAMGLHAPVACRGVEQVVAQVANIARAGVQFTHQLFDLARCEVGQRAAVIALDAGGQPVIDIEPADIEQRQLVQAIADRHHFHGIAHLRATGCGDVAGRYQRVEQWPFAARQGHMDTDPLGRCLDSVLAAQLLAQAITDPRQQVVAIAELLQGEDARCRCLGNGPGELLQGLHDMGEALWGCVAQPAGQVFFQQQGVTSGQRVLAAHQAKQRLLFVEQALEVCRVGRFAVLPGRVPGERQALALDIDQVP